MSKSENAKSLEERAAAVPTELHERFAQWIYEQTGVRPDTKSVQLACIFRMEFQASDENQKALAERKAAAEAKRKKQAAEKKARLEKQLAALKAELEKTETAESMPAETPAPAKKTAAPKAEDKPAATRSRARKATATASEAPAKATTLRARTRKTAAPKTTTPAAK
ncbi:hypothetical protein GCM10010215_39990 [Streptomyces virginiae]|uniref:Uncharacterized protein n=1 Tax=Streptomyces virginiae TaxID=1961 RepID=A0ABQ3NZI7_STRVG|nr:hypothetical protein [Streptomyces virginiae]MBP2343802.1 hypothetical protein [Streptomyces virginiae]GGQ10952.1 hypothetical protein GCM10010215_39990 [Streptomyces virginiae]GHI18194.1 hypothetical protein Scinn_76570 [Streptomyces virginiae]